MHKDIIEKIKPELDRAINYFRGELNKIHTSRPSPSLVEDIEVDCFGQKLPLKQLGAINVTGAREIVVQPWDESYIEPIIGAVSRSPLGVSVSAEKNVVRLSFPTLSEEHRKNLTRMLAQKAEEARRTIRHWRQEAWDEVQDKTRLGEIREDDKYRAKDELQEIVDDAQEKIEEMREAKDKEIME